MSRLKQRLLVFDDTLSLMRVPGGVAMDEWQTVSNPILGWTTWTSGTTMSVSSEI